MATRSAMSGTGPSTGAAIRMTPASGQLGAVTRASDWTSPWAFGLRNNNADEPLWFAN